MTQLEENLPLVVIDEFRLSGERHANVQMPVLIRDASTQILVQAKVRRPFHMVLASYG
jgi:hypothetical protein